jgi:hypothetical protein
MPDFEPKILAFACNWCPSVFFFEAEFSAGSGSQRKKWVKKKLALTCSNSAFNIKHLGNGGYQIA